MTNEQAELLIQELDRSNNSYAPLVLNYTKQNLHTDGDYWITLSHNPNENERIELISSNNFWDVKTTYDIWFKCCLAVVIYNEANGPLIVNEEYLESRKNLKPGQHIYSDIHRNSDDWWDQA